MNSNAFFKAKNKAQAISEITNRLGGSSDITDFLVEFILDLYKNDSRMKKFPMAVFIHEEKPSFTLNDGEMLEGLALDLISKKASPLNYMGSSDTVYLHQKEQLSRGMTTPENIIAIFITKIPYNGKLAWTVDIVGNLVKQISFDKSEETDLDKIKAQIEKNFSDKKHDVYYSDQEVNLVFKRKIKNLNIEDITYFLGKLNEWTELSPSGFYCIEMEENFLLIKYRIELKSLDNTRLAIMKFENHLDSVDSDIRRINRQ